MMCGRTQLTMPRAAPEGTGGPDNHKFYIGICNWTPIPWEKLDHPPRNVGPPSSMEYWKVIHVVE